MTERFDAEGIFWRINAPDRQVPGRLVFDPVTGGTLSLIGSFDAASSTIAIHTAGRTLLQGVAGRKMITLHDCFQASTHLDIPGILRETWFVGKMLTGAQLFSDERLRFAAVTLTIDNLPQWIGRSGLKIQVEAGPQPGMSPRVSIALEPLLDETVELSQGRLRLLFSYGMHGDNLTSSTLIHGCAFEVRLDEVIDLNEQLMQYATALRDLVTIGVDSASQIEEITLWHPNVVRELSDGRTQETPTKLWLQNRFANSDETPRQPNQMLFTFDQFGGLEAVGNWLTVAERYRAVLNSLLSSRYGIPVFEENRFQNFVQAAETFHRIRFPNFLRPKSEYTSLKRNLVKQVPRQWRNWLNDQLQYSNEPRFVNRLIDLSDLAGAPFATLVGDMERWVNSIKRLRNSLVHYQGERPVISDGERIHFLAESVFYLVVLCLMRESFVLDSVIAGLVDNEGFQILKTQLVRQLSD